MSAETAPIIVIDHSSDEDYIPPSHLKPSSKRNQTKKSNARLTASPTKQRIKIEPESDDLRYSFMTKAQATVSASHKNQIPITQFFTSPGKKPVRQPSIASFFSPRPKGTEVTLPETDNEPLAPLPDPFIYRNPSPGPAAFSSVLVPDSASAMGGEVVKRTLKRTFSEVTEPLSNSTAKSADSPLSKFVAIRSVNNPSASTAVLSSTVNRRVWAAVPAVRRSSSSSGIHTPPTSTQPTKRFIDPFAITSTNKASLPSAALSSMPVIASPIPRTPTPTSSAFVLGFKAVPTQPRRTTYTPPTCTKPVREEKSMSEFVKTSCDRCNHTFMVTLSTAKNPAGDGFLCPACASQPTIMSSSPLSSLDDGERPSTADDRCADLYALDS
ncbi:hypothetical protein K440DRAFT_388130 [Wilcoxina mikolae CBS 423.85]|nr:hypothetical protein K440DRAFT_388130 [Wilcoxina mikolae CBS 423.85]